MALEKKKKGDDAPKQTHNKTQHRTGGRNRWRHTVRMTAAARKQTIQTHTDLHYEEEQQDDKHADVRVNPGGRAAQTGWEGGPRNLRPGEVIKQRVDALPGHQLERGERDRKGKGQEVWGEGEGMNEDKKLTETEKGRENRRVEER